MSIVFLETGSAYSLKECLKDSMSRRLRFRNSIVPETITHTDFSLSIRRRKPPRNLVIFLLRKIACHCELLCDNLARLPSPTRLYIYIFFFFAKVCLHEQAIASWIVAIILFFAGTVRWRADWWNTALAKITTEKTKDPDKESSRNEHRSVTHLPPLFGSNKVSQNKRSWRFCCHEWKASRKSCELPSFCQFRFPNRGDSRQSRG